MPRDIWPPPPSTSSLKEYILHKWQDSKIPCRSCKGIQVRINFPVHMLNPIRKHFGYGQVWPMCRIGPDRIFQIRLTASFSVPFFQRYGSTVQNRPGSNLDGLARIWLNSSGLKASWCAGISGSSFWHDLNQPATSFPLLDSVLFFRRRPDNIVQNQPGSNLLLADCAKWIWSGRKPMCKNHPARFWPMLPSRSGPDANQIGMFTGLLHVWISSYYLYHLNYRGNISSSFFIFI